MVLIVTAAKCEFKNLRSAHDLELSALNIMIILKKECLISEQGGSMLSGFIRSGREWRIGLCVDVFST